MDLSARKEQISAAYMRAVVATAGYMVAEWTPDRDRVDVTVATDGDAGLATHPRLDVQLKCTAQDVLREDGVHLVLPTPHLIDLSGPRHVPVIVVAMLVPADPGGWIYQHDRAMLVRRCAYWVSLRGRAAPPAGQETVTVTVPREQVFSVSALSAIMSRIDAGGQP